MDTLKYPFDKHFILKKKKAIRRQLYAPNAPFLSKRIAVLGGSTTSGIIEMLDLFLLNQGIEAQFYESEYAQYWQDAMFSEELVKFKPDLIYIHTTSRNIRRYPEISDTAKEIRDKLSSEYTHYAAMWQRIAERFTCPIIQNNFERPEYRLLGNMDISDIHGRSSYLARLNMMFYEYAQEHQDFYINDIDYLSASYGLDQWSDRFSWYMYKSALSIPAIPELAFNIANIIKSIYGKNKKAFVLDLDNTIWGGVIGDDGVDSLVLGAEMPMGQAFSDFQKYIKLHKDLGVLINICSKNDEANALAGLNHPDSILAAEDFAVIKANWDNKDENVRKIASLLNIGTDSLVFVDDNPAEREIVKLQLAGVSVPEFNKIEECIRILDKSGYFEVTSLSSDDLKRSQMYQENAERNQLQQSFESYQDFLLNLDMEASIRDFEPVYMQRIAQLTNKSNQFNLTTRRLTVSELEEISQSTNYIRLYGKLKDKFGDNGVVSVIIGKINDDAVDIQLWLMSCRVLKRNMEYAMLDELVKISGKRGIQRLNGYYLPTAKNSMVKEFYGTLGFDKVSEDEQGNSCWVYNLAGHNRKNDVIRIVEE